MSTQTPIDINAGKKTCTVCNARVHRHDSKLLADFDCYWHQFSATKLSPGHPLPLTPSQFRAFAAFLEEGHARPRPRRGEETLPQDESLRVYF